MKKFVRLVLVCVLFNFLYHPVYSQDMAKVAPEVCKVLQDTLNVKMTMVTLHPGDKLPTHTHPTCMVYFLTGGKLSETLNGKTTAMDFKPGTHLMVGPMPPHSDENVGDTDLIFLLVEIGQSPNLTAR
ncbi:MAG: cupin domain-containing protein [Bacteroidota bacterium]|nr:cupin domain-containing protein [Bacteroidota bacterium]